MLRFLCCCLLYLFIYSWILAQWREWWDSVPVLDFYLLVVSWAHLQTHLSQGCCKPRATRPIGCWLKSPKIVLYKEHLFFVNWFIFSICYNGGELTSIASLSDIEDLKKSKKSQKRPELCHWHLALASCSQGLDRQQETHMEAGVLGSIKEIMLFVHCLQSAIHRPALLLSVFI